VPSGHTPKPDTACDTQIPERNKKGAKSEAVKRPLSLAPTSIITGLHFLVKGKIDACVKNHFL
jgi:hypothetical protein